MHKGGVQTLPTASAIKFAPTANAAVNISNFPAELTILLRHVPQPEYLAKNCGRPTFNTYQAYLISNVLNTKAYLGPVSKLRPGMYQLIAQNIPEGDWDQLVISLNHDNSPELGLPLFIYADNLHIPPHITKDNDSAAANISQPAPGRSDLRLNPASYTSGVTDNTFSNSNQLNPGTVLPEEQPSPVCSTEIAKDENLLLQPGTVLPEDEYCSQNTGYLASTTASLRGKDTAQQSPPLAADLSGQVLSPIVIDELPHHALWLVNYQGVQLVGYVYSPAEPEKPLYIVHGVAGAHNRRAKPEEKGYEYWIANPVGKDGYWLRYVSCQDNVIAYPFPTTDDHRS